MMDPGRVAGQTRWRELRSCLKLLLLMLPLILWVTASQQGPRHLQVPVDPAHPRSEKSGLLLQRRHRSTTAHPLHLLSPRTALARQVSVRAVAFHWCSVEKHWIRHVPKQVLCTVVSWMRLMTAAVLEARRGSAAGFKGPLLPKPGATCVTFCNGSSPERGCCNGRTGAWPMQGAFARQARGDPRAPWMGSPECCLSTLAPWRARNLRAARYQHPRPCLRTAKPCSRRPSATPGSVQTEQADPAGAAAHHPTKYLNKAHNPSSPRPPVQGLCIDNFPNKAHNPKTQGMPGKHKSNSVPSGPKSGDCRLTKPAIQVLLLATVGARVSSAAAVTEDGLGPRPGKHHGTAHQGREHMHPTRPMKRAFNRACRRANQSLQEGTWYRNRWHTRATLNALRAPQPTALDKIPRVPRDGSSTAPTKHQAGIPLQGICLECGGSFCSHDPRTHGLV